MTIQEVERQSGMTRANIRFYEEKGLLTPQRQPNGYRDYSAVDVETLRRVRLLRSLDISIDTIRALQSGERTLEAVLAERERRWNDAKGRAGDAEALREAIEEDNSYYEAEAAERGMPVEQYKLIKKMSSVEQIEQFTGFGLYDKSFVQTLRDLKDPTPFIRGIVAELGPERKEIEYTQPQRRAGGKINVVVCFQGAATSASPDVGAALLGYDQLEGADGALDHAVVRLARRNALQPLPGRG